MEYADIGKDMPHEQLHKLGDILEGLENALTAVGRIPSATPEYEEIQRVRKLLDDINNKILAKISGAAISQTNVFEWGWKTSSEWRNMVMERNRCCDRVIHVNTWNIFLTEEQVVEAHKKKLAEREAQQNGNKDKAV